MQSPEVERFPYVVLLEIIGGLGSREKGKEARQDCAVEGTGVREWWQSADNPSKGF